MIKPLFMWAGGKTKMIPKYTERLGLPRDFDAYVEPFLGGGAMFCALVNRDGLPVNSYLNDSNPEIMKLYEAIKNDCEGLIYVLKIIEERYLKLNYAKRKDHYYLIRNAYAFQELGDGLLDTATFYFLLKTGFNGIFQTIEGSDRFASPCGLLNHTDSVFDYDLIRRWNLALKSATLTCSDWSVVLNYFDDREDANAFFFLDPPYRDSFKHYGVDEFDHDGLMRACRILADTPGNIVWLCNRWTDDNYYEDRMSESLNEIEIFDVTYTAGRRKKNEDGTHSAVKAKEVLIHNGGK